MKSVTIARNYAEALFAAGDQYGPLIDAVDVGASRRAVVRVDLVVAPRDLPARHRLRQTELQAEHEAQS